MLALLFLSHEDAAGRADSRRRAQVQQPADHVEHVDAHVADDAVAVLHERPPAAGVIDRAVRPHRGRTRPHLVVQILRRRRVGRVAAIPHVIVTADLDVGDLAQLAFFDDPVLGLDQVGRAPPLHVDLHDALVLAGRRDHRPGLDHVDADRFLDVHIRPGLAGGDHGQRVPVVRRRDVDDVELLLLEHLAPIAEDARGSSSTAAWPRSSRRPRPPSSYPRRTSRRPRPARSGAAENGRSCHTIPCR